LVDQSGSSCLLLCCAWKMGRSTTLRSTDGQRYKTVWRRTSTAQGPQPGVDRADDQRPPQGECLVCCCKSLMSAFAPQRTSPDQTSLTAALSTDPWYYDSMISP